MKLNGRSKAGYARSTGAKRLASGLAVGAALLLISHAALAAPVVNSVSYNFRSIMSNNPVDPDARGTVSGSLTRRGTTDKQRLRIFSSKLDTNVTYNLAAFVDEDTAPIAVGDLVTTRKGRSSITYVKSPRENAHPLPAAIDPITNLRELDIINGNGDTVLQSDITNSTSFSYSVKRALDNTGFKADSVGVLRLSGSARATRVSVTAAGLIPRTAYQLQVNGVTVTTKASDRKGRLVVAGPKAGLPLVLDIRTVALADGNGANIVLISTGLGIPGVGPTLRHPTIALGDAVNYAVLAGATVTSINATIIGGDLGVSPGSAVTGFPPGTINGTIHAGDNAASLAEAALTVAYNDAKGRTLEPVSVAGNLGGQTLAPGLYKSTDSLEVSSGDLVLDAQGDANGVFIFQIASTLATTSDRKIILAGEAKAANIFWQVGTSATIGSTSVFKGTIMADQSITLNTGATLEGRALARIGAVTMDSNSISIPAP